MTAPTRDTLTQAFKALASGRPGAAEALADMFLGSGDPAETVEPAGPEVSRTHTYADGSQVVGMPPFPELSPIELKAAEARRVGAPAVQPEAPPAPAASEVITADQIETTIGSNAVPAPAPAPADAEPVASSASQAEAVADAPAAAPEADPAPEPVAAPAPATSRKR